MLLHANVPVSTHKKAGIATVCCTLFLTETSVRSHHAGINFGKALVGILFVHELLPAAGGGNPIVTLRLAQDCRAADQRIGQHEYDQNPGQRQTVNLGDVPFDEPV